MQHDTVLIGNSDTILASLNILATAIGITFKMERAVYQETMITNHQSPRRRTLQSGDHPVLRLLQHGHIRMVAKYKENIWLVRQRGEKAMF